MCGGGTQTRRDPRWRMGISSPHGPRRIHRLVPRHRRRREAHRPRHPQRLSRALRPRRPARQRRCVREQDGGTRERVRQGADLRGWGQDVQDGLAPWVRLVARFTPRADRLSYAPQSTPSRTLQRSTSPARDSPCPSSTTCCATCGRPSTRSRRWRRRARAAWSCCVSRALPWACDHPRMLTPFDARRRTWF